MLTVASSPTREADRDSSSSRDPEPPLAEHLAFIHPDLVDDRMWGSLATPADDAVHGPFLPLELGLDAAIERIADPAGHPQRSRALRARGAVEDPLDPPSDDDVHAFHDRIVCRTLTS
jgi:hypothetical protein